MSFVFYVAVFRFESKTKLLTNKSIIAGKNTGFNPNSERIYAQLTQPSQDFVYFFVYYQLNWSKNQQQPSGLMDKAVDI